MTTGDLSTTFTINVDGGGPSGSDLCTLADVRAFLQEPAGDTQQDVIIQSLITDASTVIMGSFEREFAPASTSLTRIFEWPWEGELVSLAPYDLRGTPTLVQADTDQSAPVTLGADEWRLWPQPPRDGTYLAIRLRPFGVATGRNMWRNRQVKVTGDWGFPSVPGDVRRACIITVAIWLKRDVSAFSRTFNIDEGRTERPDALPAAAAKMLARYQRMPYG